MPLQATKTMDRWLLIASLFLLLLVTGCDDPDRRFDLNVPLHLANGLTEEQSESIDSTLTELFGIPNKPKLPEVGSLDQLLELASLEQAAGPVIAHEEGVTEGLYRRHCARCHGLSGDGMGPMARYQYPYPRDFRPGVFKWKSTYRDSKPTAADLDQLLEQGIPGTAMPSFRLVDKSEREILRQYVIYLAVRGQLERELVWFVAEELEPGELLDLSNAEQKSIVFDDLLVPIIESWLAAENQVVDLPQIGEADEASISAGRDLFHSPKAGCMNCHGQAGQGGITPADNLDLWAKELRQFSKLPGDKLQEALRKTFPLVEIEAPRLVDRLPHGGLESDHLFRRLHQGIAGAPMPAVGPRRPGEGSALSDTEIIQLVHYVRSIMMANMSGPVSQTISSEEANL